MIEIFREDSKNKRTKMTTFRKNQRKDAVEYARKSARTTGLDHTVESLHVPRMRFAGKTGLLVANSQ